MNVVAAQARRQPEAGGEFGFGLRKERRLPGGQFFVGLDGVGNAAPVAKGAIHDKRAEQFGPDRERRWQRAVGQPNLRDGAPADALIGAFPVVGNKWVGEVGGGAVNDRRILDLFVPAVFVR